MDADLSHDPSEIPKIINYLDEFPFVIGSRYSLGGKCEMSGFRFLLSFVGNKFLNIF
jgi:dolichol-phosphate mannosyltransferase